MLIGIAGYLEPGDEYQLILPEVASWSIDKRNKSQRKQNYQGGFSTSTTKYDESKFMSVSWDSLPEQDINQANGYDNYTEPVAIITAPVTVSTSTVVAVSNHMLIPDNTKVFIRRGTSYITMNADTHTDSTIKLSSTVPVALSKGESFYVYNKALSGLLTLASLSATGQTHLLRSFSGNLVKVLFNSPKYEAIGGSDLQGQLYYSVRMDIDIVTDTTSYQYKAVKSIAGSTYNEQLPINNSIVSTPVSVSVTNLFVKTSTSLGFMSANAGNVFTLESLLPYKVTIQSVGSIYTNLAKQIVVFKDYLAAETQIPKEIKAGTTVIYTDPNPLVTLSIPNVPDYVNIGKWEATIKYGVWDTTEGNVVNAPLGAILKLKSTNAVYLSIVSNNSALLTDTTAWLPLANKTLIVVHKGKVYRMAVTPPATGNTEPGVDTTSWVLVTIPNTPISVTVKPTYMTDLLNNALFVVIAPFVLATDTTPPLPFDSTNILKIPVLKEQFTHGVEFSTSEQVIKTSSTMFNNNKIYASAIDNTVDIDLPTAIKFNEFEPFRISSLVIPPSTSSVFLLKTDSIAMDINQLNTAADYKLCTYTIVNNDPGFANVSLGTFATSLISGTVVLHFRDKIGKRRVFTTFTSTTASTTEVVKLASAADFTKSLYEIKYDHKLGKVEVIIYKYALAADYKTVPVLNNTIDYDNVGFKVIKTKLVYTSTTFTDTNTDTQTLNFNYKSSSLRVAYGASNTYVTKSLSDSYILKLFSLEGDSWL